MQRNILASVRNAVAAMLSCFFILAGSCILSAQNSLVRGSVASEDDKKPIQGATVVVKGDPTQGVTTDENGSYSILVSKNTILIYSHVGYTSIEEQVNDRMVIDILLPTEVTALNELVVVGYGTQDKNDLTGSIASLSSEKFNPGNFAAPDQLIKGLVAGVQITNNSGQPGVATTINIRGNSVLTGSGRPLIVVDGVPLSGTSARPDTDDFGGTTSPQGNPLNFLNPWDIASIDVLKDASAAAIYGSRGAYGVILITTKKSASQEPTIDVDVSMGFASIQRKVKVLSAGQYKNAISYYGVNPANDNGGDVDALASILRTGMQYNYNVSLTGGHPKGSYRLSLGYFDQEGIILRSQLKKYSASFSTNLQFLEKKQLGIDLNLTPNQYSESIPLIRNEGSIIGDAIVWNPTDSLLKENGSPTFRPGLNNPLAVSKYYDDHSRVTSLLASVSPYYKLSDWLTFKMILSTNYSTGSRRTSVNEKLDANRVGSASIYNNEHSNNHMANTVTFQKTVAPGMHLTALAGHEYIKISSKRSSISVQGSASGFGDFGLDYTDYIQYSDQSGRNVSSFATPIAELQSFFGRAMVTYKSKYLMTAMFRVDGSSKFGTRNKYGYFPSFSAAWIASEENFLKVDMIDFLKFRAGWGRTGNQEFPSGAATTLYRFNNNGSIGPANNANPNLKWQTDEQLNIGLDFRIITNRISGTVEYFRKKTADLLYPSPPVQPAPPDSGPQWVNLDGNIINEGMEATLNAIVVEQSSISWNLGMNATFMHNNVSGLPSTIITGSLHGSGMSGVSVQRIHNGSPMNSFYTRRFLGIDDDTGLSRYEDAGYMFYDIASPNPQTLLGVNSSLRFKKVSLSIVMFGAFGHSIYNNTLNSVINVGNINVGKNIALENYHNPVKESLANPVTPSSRFIEKGDYLKLNTVCLAYNVGSIGKSLRNIRLYVTGQNLFTITNYSGFDPEVNTDKSMNGVPSQGIDYVAYPSARTLIGGFNFSL